MTRSRTRKKAFAAAALAVVVVTLLAWPGTARAHIVECHECGLRGATGVSLSADGRVLAYATTDRWVWSLYVCDRQADTWRQLVEDPWPVGVPSVSADGRFVAYSCNGHLYVYNVGTEAEETASKAGDGTEANDTTYSPALNADGRYVAFVSEATNLVPDDTNGASDVFIHDTQTGATIRVSVDGAGAEADGASSRPSLSADGRYVAFESLAGNLVPGDSNGASDVFVHDTQTGATIRVSVDGAGAEADGASSRPSISADGRYVAFESLAEDLVPGDTNGASDVFIHDTQTGETTRASVRGVAVEGNAGSGSPSVSGDGRYIAFHSAATNLVTGDTNGMDDVFVRDRETSRTVRVSVTAEGTEGDDRSSDPCVSADGRWVAFVSGAASFLGHDSFDDPNNDDPDVFIATVEFGIEYRSIRGGHRYETAQLLSQGAFPGPLPAGSGVVVAPGETYQEALCGAPLAAAYGGPVLLTPRGALENGTKAELERLDPDYVLLIGLSGDVAAGVEAALPEAVVVSINASDAYQMSHLVAEALADRVGATGGDISSATGIVTIGTKFVDALGVSPLACAKLWPIILTDQTAYGTPLHAQALATFADLGITRMLKVGTYSAPPSGVTSVANLSGVAPTGQSHLARYYTSANIAGWALAHAGLSFAHTAFATGDKFPDALASGPFLAGDEGILLVSPLNGPVPNVIQTTLAANRDSVEELTFIACIEPVVTTVRVTLPAAPADGTLSFLPYGDSKTLGWGDETDTGGYPPALANLISAWSTPCEVLPCIARNGWTVTQMAAGIESDLAGYVGGTPDAVLVNLGTNQTEVTQAAWVTPMVKILDALHAKWPDAQIFVARVYRGARPTATLDDVWIPAAVAAAPSCVHLGIDERTFLPGDGLMFDAVHPNHAGYVRTAEEWNAFLLQWFAS